MQRDSGASVCGPRRRWVAICREVAGPSVGAGKENNCIVKFGPRLPPDAGAGVLDEAYVIRALGARAVRDPRRSGYQTGTDSALLELIDIGDARRPGALVKGPGGRPGVFPGAVLLVVEQVRNFSLTQATLSRGTGARCGTRTASG